MLLAEDDDVNQEVAVLMLPRLGYQVDIAGNGVEALEAWTAASAGAVRTPVIAMTAGALQGDRRRAEDAGMDGFVSKPVRLDELARAPEEAAGRQQPPTGELLDPTTVGRSG